MLSSSDATAVSNGRAGFATPPGSWHFVGTVPARGDDEYAVVVPTLKDSTITDGMYRTVFFVSALTAIPLTYFDSPIDSGYSVDNLVPSIPSGFVVAYNTGHGNEMFWQPSLEPDVRYYRVYRSASGGDSPPEFELVAVTASTSWIDPEFDGWPVQYRVTAVDFSGNESDQAEPSQPPTGIDDRPATFQLRSNAPNPFSKSTAIRFDVPSGGGHVRIGVYDVRGKLVRSIVSDWLSGGSRELVWDGSDQVGRPCASGVYFLRLNALSNESVRKIVIAR
jgi:hypothetical protein